MRSLIRATIFVVVATVVFGCKPKAPESAAEAPAAPVDAPAGEVTSSAVEPKLEACRLKMTAPAAHTWTTYWDPNGVLREGEGPSHVHSVYWANAKEKKSLEQKNGAIPIDIACSSEGPPDITISLAAFSSTEKDIPLGTGTYPIVGKQSGAVKPGQVLAGVLLYNKGMFDAKSGTLKLERFDKGGVAGSFTIDGRELLGGTKAFHVEGTFDMPCRGGMLESECRVNKVKARE